MLRRVTVKGLLSGVMFRCRSILLAVFAAAAVTVVGIGSPPRAYAGFTYDFVNYPADQNGWTIAGDIVLPVSNGFGGGFLSWHVTLTKGGMTYEAGDDTTSVMYATNVIVTPEAISLSPTPAFPYFSFLIRDYAPDNQIEIGWDRYADGPSEYWGQVPSSSLYAWHDTSPSFVANHYIIATASSVPEPTSLTIWGLALVGLF